MRICVIGKFPPIQGGVSMRTYWSAHGLAARGHEVHVVTNAKEVRAPFRMHMRPEDWTRCEAAFEAGSVTVHWTEPVDRSQSYIPMASPFVSKLAAIAARVHSERPFDVIFSHYLEPYGVAGFLAAQITGVPHVVRMAGSDAGRLWHHPQFEALYDHVLRSAAIVIASGTVAERAVRRGVDADRIAAGGDFVVPEDLFSPDGDELDMAALRTDMESDPELCDLLWGGFAVDRPYFGICGKLGENKGSFALLAALRRLKDAGLEVGLVALAHGGAAEEGRFRDLVCELDLVDCVLQIPFLPHWRVPEFLRGCLAVCCLEQNFPIGFHSPIAPREVLLSGTCLVASTEMVRKLPAYARLPHGYGCVAVPDVSDVAALADALAAIVRDPEPAAVVGTRGRTFARELQRGISFPQRLEQILAAAAAGRRPIERSAEAAVAEAADSRFPLTRLAVAEIETLEGETCVPPAQTIDLAWARDVLAAIQRLIDSGRRNLEPLAAAVEIEIAVATAEAAGNATSPPFDPDPLFRLRMGRWAMAEGDLAALMPLRDPQIHVLEFDYDVSEFMSVRTVVELPSTLTPQRSYIVAFGRTDGGQRDPLLVDALTAGILRLSDGSRTAAEIVRELGRETGTPDAADSFQWLESLFVHGLISLRDNLRRDNDILGKTTPAASARG